MITAKSILSISYALDIPVKKLIEIMDKDSSRYVPLYIVLENIKGVFSIEYNGHFGPHIFLSVEIENDDAETWKLIYDAIENYL